MKRIAIFALLVCAVSSVHAEPLGSCWACMHGCTEAQRLELCHGVKAKPANDRAFFVWLGLPLDLRRKLSQDDVRRIMEQAER